MIRQRPITKNTGKRAAWTGALMIALMLLAAGLFTQAGSVYAAGEPADTVQVSTAEELTEAMANASADPNHPTLIELTKSIVMPADTPVVSAEGTHVILAGAKEGLKLTPDAGWNATSEAVTAANVTGLITVSGDLYIQNLTIDTSAAAKGVRCIGVNAAGMLEMTNVTVTGSKLTRVGGLGIYTLGNVIMNEGAVIEKITAYTSSTIKGVGVCVGYDNKTKAQGSLIMNSGATVRNNKSSKQNGARLNGIGIYCQGELIMNAGSSVKGNTAVYSDQGVGIYVEGGAAAYPASMILRGGEISGNCENGSTSAMYGTVGGGVAVYNNASLTMTGGKICNNLARDGGGGLVLTGMSRCSAELSGGSIEKNRSYATGAGIRIEQTSPVLTLKGKIKIANNINEFDAKEAKAAGLQNTTYYHQNNGGGIHNAGTLIIEGGTISGNRCIASHSSNTDVYGQGGGVFNAGVMTMTGGKITGNTSGTGAGGGNKAGSGGGIATKGGDEPGETYLMGGTITGNQAGGLGNDVWLNADDSSYSMTAREMSYTPSPGILYLGDKDLDNLTLNIGELTIPPGTWAFVNGTLAGSAIGINSMVSKKGTIIAKPGEGYEPLIVDARALASTKGKHIYTLSKEGNIVIGKANQTTYKSITDAQITIEAPAEDLVYTGTGIRPGIKVVLDGKQLVPDQDYQTVYYNNTDASSNEKKAKVKVFGMGDYDGQCEETFMILRRSIAEGAINPIRDRLYTGEAVEPSLTVTVQDRFLEAGADYDAEFTGNTGTGTAQITLTGKGNYTGTLTGTFAIISREGKRIAKNEAELSSCLSSLSGSTSAGKPGTIYVSGTVSITKSLSVPVNTYAELIGENEEACLKAAASMGSDAEKMFAVSGSLTIADLKLDCGAASGIRAASVSSSGTLTIESGSLLTGGGAIKGRAVYNAGTLWIKGGMLCENNKAFGTSAACGTIYNTGTMTMTAGVISDNLAVRGGAIYNAGNASLEGGFLKDNTATGDVKNQPYGAYGGAVYNDEEAVLTLGSGLKITGNSSKHYGGGIVSFGQMTIDGATVSDNTAVTAGAGVFSCGPAQMLDGSITNNTINTNSFALVDIKAARNVNDMAACGGGVCVQSGTFTMKGGVISGNLVRSRYNSEPSASGRVDNYGEMANGGGVYVANDGSDADRVPTFVMEGGQISGNTADSRYLSGDVMGHGGGIYVLGGENSNAQMTPGRLILKGGVVSGNQASETGDEIYLGDAYELLKERTSTPVKYKGSALLRISGHPVVGSGETDGLFIPDGTTIKVSAALEAGSSLFITAAGEQETLLAETDGESAYELTETDADAFANATPIRKAQLVDHKIVLVPQMELADVCDLNIKGNYTYTGSNIRPKPTVTRKDTGKELSEDEYVVSYSKTRSIEPGSYRLTVTGTETYREYSGELAAGYKIVRVNMSQIKAKAIGKQVYTGKVIEYIPKVGDLTYRGKSLLRGEDYTISYKNNKAMGLASVILKGQNHFTGTKEITFRIIPKQAAVSKLKSTKKKTLTVTWRKDAGVSGYQILIAKNKKFTSGKKTQNVTKYISKGITFKGLTKKKVYYVKVRAYKTISGSKSYGAWSSVKKLKIK